MQMATDAAEPRMQRFDRDVDGILLLDKPAGLTSNAALQRTRRLYRALKAGHAGSLDPLATGLLPICFGQATKVCGQLLEASKSYRVVARLGERRDTADADGQVVETAPVPVLDPSQVRAVLARFLGHQLQVPPMYSALKQDGKRLYELARAGTTVERAPRRIRIERLELLRGGDPATPDELELDVTCSKGTYIRSLVEDVAGALGTLGYVQVLRRTAVAAFGDRPLHTLAALEARLAGGERLEELLLPVDSVFASCPEVFLDALGEADLLHGRQAMPTAAPTAAPTVAASGIDGGCRAYGRQSGRFLGLVRTQPDGSVQPVRLFVRVTADRA